MNAIQIRRVRPSDQQALAVFYAKLSPDARRARFLGYASGLTGAAARTFCSPDHLHEEGFVATAGTHGGSPVIVGHLCLVAAGSDSAELGVAVADGYRRRGIGRRLFQAALDWARDKGCARITASAFADNHPVLRLLTSTPYPALVRPADGGIVDVIIPIAAPTPSHRAPERISRSCRAAWRRRPRPAPAVAG